MPTTPKKRTLPSALAAYMKGKSTVAGKKVTKRGESSKHGKAHEKSEGAKMRAMEKKKGIPS
jgi:hypothetical protein